ncbi:MAG: 16S rRNA (cytosine(1402)-N(4))-methyltransferase RsmH [Deltaproteobacteria bacterium]|nr:16S rRNA (cytosine(1402)-N(4))-methyltransferase RsmH [Deltaproteobacteria bacterium]
MAQSVHIPILTDVLLELLQLPAGARCIDATIDGGGHTAAILEHTAPAGQVLGIDRDSELLTAVRRRLGDAVDAGRLHLASGSFRELTHIAMARHFAPVQAVIFDLGVSSYHFDVSGRGFSFMRDEPLDMRFDPTDVNIESAAQILNNRDAEELTAIFFKLGEERFSRRIASTIVARRPLQTTAELLDCIKAALPGRVRWQAARSAARVFQALRIAVNDELDAITDALPQALSLLAPGGRLAVLSFHSLEDRIVKYFYRAEQAAGRVRIITKRPLTAGDDEVRENSRAASAKLRVCERVAGD